MVKDDPEYPTQTFHSAGGIFTNFTGGLFCNNLADYSAITWGIFQ
jgi:hypothetical protein